MKQAQPWVQVQVQRQALAIAGKVHRPGTVLSLSADLAETLRLKARARPISGSGA